MAFRNRINGIAVVLLSLALVLGWMPALGQAGGRLALLPPDLTHFPRVSFLMEAYAPDGKFIPDLSDSDLRLIEDGAARPVEVLTRLQSGLHLVAAFNTSPSLAAAQNGTTPLEQVRKILLAWCAAQSNSGLDEFSLVSNSGEQATKLTDPVDWGAALRAFAPDLLKGQPSLTSLTQAFDLVTDAGRKTSSKRAVLWITPPLSDASLAALPNLAERATGLSARLFVWLVVPPGSGETKSHAALADLARRTGGQFAVFNGSQPVPDLEGWFQPLRYIYRVDYTSAVRLSGGHRLQVQMIRDEASPATGEQRFNLTLIAPNPMFISPPVRVQRSRAQLSAGGQRADLALMVEFPDGLRRALVSTRLYVDGILVSESAEPAPAAVTWPLEGYTTSQRHAVRVEVEDILGYRRSSIEIPIEVEVEPEPAPSGFDAAFFTAGSDGLMAGGAALAAILGVGSAVWLLRRRPVAPARAKSSRTWEVPHLSVPALSNRRTVLAQDVPARLVRLSESGQALPANSIPLPRQEISFGSDPKKAAVVVQSPSVDGLHARICPRGEQEYVLVDAGSLAGTWVNYELVPPGGVSLAHGDLVQMGLESYRFETKQARQSAFLHIRRVDKESYS